MKGKNDLTPFWESVKCVKDKENICLTLDQARHIYK